MLRGKCLQGHRRIGFAALLVVAASTVDHESKKKPA